MMTERTAPAGRPAARRGLVGYAVAVVAGLAFGGACQYLSTIGPAGAAASNLFAPWLLLAFALGAAQASVGAAARAGALGLLAAAAAYTVMIMSPAEGVHRLTLATAEAVVTSQARWLFAAVVAGPCYGLLGQRWRSSRWRVSAVLGAAPALLEPLLRLAGPLGGDTVVSVAELAAGLALAGYFAAAACSPVRRSG